MLYVLYVLAGLWYKNNGIVQRYFVKGGAGKIRIQ
jgi:hypothetical protein